MIRFTHSLFQFAAISEHPKPPLGFVVGWALLSMMFICAGGLWAFNPKLYVRAYRRIAIGDYAARSPEWEQQILGLSGRICGYVFFCAGIGGIYVLLRMLKLL